jgi:hypothetical protein
VITAVARVMKNHLIESENTRVEEIVDADKLVFEVFQASTEFAHVINEENANRTCNIRNISKASVLEI